MAKDPDPFIAHAMLVNTIGLSIIVESLSEAYYFLKHNSSTTAKIRNKAEECRDAFLFIQGTGLDMVIHQYGCGYDPHEIRTTFFSLAKRKDLIDADL